MSASSLEVPTSASLGDPVDRIDIMVADRSSERRVPAYGRTRSFRRSRDESNGSLNLAGAENGDLLEEKDRNANAPCTRNSR